LCIALWSPGKAITIQFILEQIWLEGRFGHVQPTEVYDILVAADEEGVTELYALSPHWMACAEGGVGTLECGYPAMAGSRWGWYYLPGSDALDPTRTLVVPDPATGIGYALPGTLRFCTAEWHPRLREPQIVDALKTMKKSIFRLKVDGGVPSSLGPESHPLWLRIIARPMDLDVATRVRHSVSGHGCPSGSFTWDLSVTCPGNVMERVEKAIRTTSRDNPDVSALSLLEQVVLTEGFRAPGTCVRVVDHRIVLATEDEALEILPQSCAHYDRVKFVGTQSSLLKRDGEERPFDYAEWSGGGRQNDHEDIVLQALAILNYVNYKRGITKSRLISETGQANHRQAALLIDKMKHVGLLSEQRKEHTGSEDGYAAFFEENERQDPEVERQINEKLVALRKVYSDPEAFVDYPQGREGYAELHRFAIPFRTSWTNEEGLPWARTSSGRRTISRLLLVASVTGAVFGILAFILALAAFLRG